MNILLACKMLLFILTVLSSDFVCASQKPVEAVQKRTSIPRTRLTNAIGSHPTISHNARSQKDAIKRRDSNDGDYIIHDQDYVVRSYNEKTDDYALSLK